MRLSMLIQTYTLIAHFTFILNKFSKQMVMFEQILSYTLVALRETKIKHDHIKMCKYFLLLILLAKQLMCTLSLIGLFS